MSDHGHDDWFRHDSDEAAPQQEHASHINTTAMGFTLLAIVFGVLLTIIVLSMYYVQYAGARRALEQEGVKSAQEYIAYRDQSQRNLAEFGWADQAAGTVNLPIDRAMDDVVEMYAEPGMHAAAAWVGPASRRVDHHLGDASGPDADLAMQQEVTARDE